MDNKSEHISNLVKVFGQQKQWVNWCLVEKDNKQTKIPLTIAGGYASSTEDKTWSTYNEVKNVSSNIGIIFTSDQTLLGIDIDHCLENNQLPGEIKTFIELANTYTEISPSGTGLHLYIKLTGPLKLLKNKNAPYELYTSGRFFTVTQKIWGEERGVRTMTPEEAVTLLNTIGYPWGSKEIDNCKIKQQVSTTNLDDASIIDKMFDSKNGDEIYALYNSDISKYNNDDSSADMALCSHLAFWTGRNASQMERIWLASPLGQREKTEKRVDYRARTIKFANQNCKETYQSNNFKIDDVSEKTSIINTITFQEFGRLELPKERWLIKDIIPKEGFVTIASPSGEKKTWVALSMAGAIAKGTNFLGNEEFKTIKGRVLYVDEEMADTELQRRIKLLSLDDTSDIILSRQNNLNFNNDNKQIDQLFELIEAESIKAVFIDTFRAVAGGLKEDKAEDIRAYYDKFKPFKNKGVAVIFLDHCRKPSHFEGSIPKKEQLLGSQDKLASIEMLHMIKSEEVSGDILFYTRKARNGKEFLPFRIEMKEDWNEQCQTEKIELIYKGKLEEKETVMDNAKKAIKTLLSSGSMKRQEIILTLQKDHKHMGERNISGAIKALENNQEITFTKVGKENLYQLLNDSYKDDDFVDFDNVAEVNDT